MSPTPSASVAGDRLFRWLVAEVGPAERARRVITGCEVELLPNAAHMMMFDEPDLVSERILHFLQGAEDRERKPR